MGEIIDPMQLLLDTGHPSIKAKMERLEAERDEAREELQEVGTVAADLCGAWDDGDLAQRSPRGLEAVVALKRAVISRKMVNYQALAREAAGRLVCLRSEKGLKCIEVARINEGQAVVLYRCDCDNCAFLAAHPELLEKK